ncbi:hypothetical protein AHF37_01400 [Paragonimus kellicotti]|nr:hypothetical protein AHF37_01400 [Paragonimus kellicotti]
MAPSDMTCNSKQDWLIEKQMTNQNATKQRRIKPSMGSDKCLANRNNRVNPRALGKRAWP